jgi:2-C-methyl-D-erythritol 4-phosphate cytidylyltransferase
MPVAVIIVAAGRGLRLGSEFPKQYLPLGRSTSIRMAIEAFLQLDAVRWIVPVINKDDHGLCTASLSGIDDPRLLDKVDGGATRAISVRHGLEHILQHKPDRVLIHDAARPFVSAAIIHEVISALDTNDGAFAALPVVDALWKSDDTNDLKSVPREGLWRAQTPQGFWFKSILEAHRRHEGEGTDDVAVAREAGLRVSFVLGSEQNYKITTQADLERARLDVDRMVATLNLVSQSTMSG